MVYTIEYIVLTLHVVIIRISVEYTQNTMYKFYAKIKSVHISRNLIYSLIVSFKSLFLMVSCVLRKGFISLIHSLQM